MVIIKLNLKLFCRAAVGAEPAAKKKKKSRRPNKTGDQKHKARRDKTALAQGNEILITGYSGSGKTTLINALVGLINGITFEGPHQPVNLYSNFVIMYQSIRADIPTSKVNN